MFLAVGAHLSKRQDIPARDAGKVYDALQFLKEVETGREHRGSVAASRSTAAATRQWMPRGRREAGAEPLIIYRRTREQMPAHDFEADEAIEEGVKIHWLRTIKADRRHDAHRRGDAARREWLPVPTGEFETLEADSLISPSGRTPTRHS